MLIDFVNAIAYDTIVLIGGYDAWET